MSSDDRPGIVAAFRAASRRTLRCARPLLIYGYAQTMIAALLLAPLLSWLVLGALRMTVGGAVVNFDIASFAASLPALLIVLVWAVGVAALALVGFGGPVLILTEAAGGRRAGLKAVVGRVASRLPRAASQGALRLTLLVFLAMPIAGLAVTLIASLALSPFGGLEMDQVLPDNFVDVGTVVFGVLALGVLCLYLAVRWSFCLHFFLVEERRLGASMAESTRQVTGNRMYLTRLYVFGGVLHALVVGAVALLLGGVHWVVLEGLGLHATFGVDVVLAGLLVIDLIVLTGVILLVTANAVSLVTGAYERLRAAEGTPLTETAALPLAGPNALGVRGMRVVLLVAGALIVGTALTIPKVLAEREALARPVLVTAHRGNSSVAPDNSLASVRSAIEAGADFAEIDIQEAKDGTLVVVHDTHLLKLAGIDRSVYDMTGAELAEVDVGSHFSPAFREERMPTLRQLIELARGRIKLNIELKVHGREKRFAAAAVEEIRALDFREQCVITSLDAAVLAEVRSLDADLPLGIILTAFLGNVHDLDVDFYSVNSLVATNAFIRSAHHQGRDVHVWTINEESKILRMLDRFPDNLITDYPARVRRILDARTPEDVIQAGLRRLFSQ